MMRLKMKAWDEKIGDFVELDALGEEITKPKAQSKYINAFYKPVEDGFLTPEQKVEKEQPHNEPVAEKSTPAAAYEYNIEIACAQEDIVTYQIGAFSLGKTDDEAVISSWKKSASQTGFTLLTASVMVNEPKALYREFFQSSGSALAFQDVNPVKKGSGTHTESFVPIKTAVQVGEQLGWPTTGFYYHFIDDKLTHEYQIVDNDASTFFATQSSAEQLSSSLLSDHQYNFILLPWKVNNAPVTRQHLLYLPQKMTQEEFAELNATWLDENACLLDVEIIVKSKNESALTREKTKGDEVTYVIQSGDSLSKIAHQQGTTVEHLVELNPQYKGKEGQIQVGDPLIIESNKDESTHIPAHIVVLNGDGNRETWDEIAKQHCMAPKELLTLNAMFEDNPSALKVGDELCVTPPQETQDKAPRTTLPPIALTHIGQVSSFVNSFSSMSKRLLNAFVVAALSDKNIPANTPIVNVGKKTLRSTELSASNDLELLANGKGELVKIKAENESVKAIQKALLKLNFDLGSAGADGKFGSGTESVIKTFQSTYTPTNKIHADYKIGSADGIVGKNTLLALDEAVVGQWVYEQSDEMDEKWLSLPKGNLTFQSEGNDINSSIFFSRRAHVPNNKGVVIGNSGITFGRGLDIGQRTKDEVKDIFAKVTLNCKPLSQNLLNWLKEGAGKVKQAAFEHYKTLDEKVPKEEQLLTRKQQHFLFLEIYPFYEKRTEALLTKNDVRKAYDKDNIFVWDKLPKKVKEVLVDLTYRGDNRSSTRKLFMPPLISDIKNDKTGTSSLFYKIMSDEMWKTTYYVDENRFTQRKNKLL
ncbi:pesticin C-terminus-like muramidase [Aliivibrio sifiae]|uniref:pesticin C-terminus-like muramidase n=1 Tax=Aliivibrio sifiae TaxID=566293 RepID=UPI003D1395D6